MSLRSVFRSSVMSAGSPRAGPSWRRTSRWRSAPRPARRASAAARQALARAERERFRGRLDEGREPEIDRELHGVARAVRPHVHDLAGELFQHRPGALEVLGLAADHGEQLAVARRAGWCRAPANRSAARRRPRPRGASSRPVIGCSVLISMNSLPRTSPDEESVLAAEDAPHAVILGDDRDHGAVGGVGDRARMRRDRHAAARRRAFIAAASRSQPITSTAAVGEPRLDGAAHAAQSDEADLHRRLTSARWLFERR